MYQDNYNMYNLYQKNNNLMYRNDFFTNNEEIISLNEAVELIRQSINDEKEDELFYNTLIKQAPSLKEKNIISSIRDDEKKHNLILRNLYYEFTKQVMPSDTLTNVTNNNLDYKSNLEKALFGELNAVKKYRRIMGTMPSGNSYTLLMSIMTDELRHANEYNFLINNLKTDD